METQNPPVLSENSVPVDVDVIAKILSNPSEFMESLYPQLKTFKKAYLLGMKAQDPSATLSSHHLSYKGRHFDSNFYGNTLYQTLKALDAYAAAGAELNAALVRLRDVVPQSESIDITPDLLSREPEVKPLIQGVRERLKAGEGEYGTPLSTFNGRDAIQDFEEEIYDSVAYSIQSVFESIQKISGLKSVNFEGFETRKNAVTDEDDDE